MYALGLRYFIVRVRIENCTIGLPNTSAVLRLLSALRTATSAFDVRSSGLFCSRPGGLELATRLPARSVKFRQFSPGPENIFFSRFASVQRIRGFADCALYKSTIDTDVDVDTVHIFNNSAWASRGNCRQVSVYVCVALRRYKHPLFNKITRTSGITRPLKLAP